VPGSKRRSARIERDLCQGVLAEATRQTIRRVSCGSQIPSAWISRPGREAAQRVCGKIDRRTAKKRQYLRPATGEYARYPRRVPLLAMWHGVARNAADRPLSQVWLRTALLQTVCVLRSRRPLRVYATCAQAHRAKRRAQRLHVLRVASRAGEGDFHPRHPASE